MKITFISFYETSLKDYFVSKCNFHSLELYLRQSSSWGLGFGLKRLAGLEASGSARPLSWYNKPFLSYQLFSTANPANLGRIGCAVWLVTQKGLIAFWNFLFHQIGRLRSKIRKVFWLKYLFEKKDLVCNIHSHFHFEKNVSRFWWIFVTKRKLNKKYTDFIIKIKTAGGLSYIPLNSN